MTITPSNSYRLAAASADVQRFTATKTGNPAETLRQLVEWCDWQDENHFTPSVGMSVNDLLSIYMKVAKADVEAIEDYEEAECA